MSKRGGRAVNDLEIHRERAERLDAERLWALAFDSRLEPAAREIYKDEIRRRHDVLYEEAEGTRPRPNQSVWDAFPPREPGSEPRYRYRYAAKSTTQKEVSMDTRKFSGGKFLKASAIPEPTRVRIKSVDDEHIGDDHKLVVRFDEFGARGLPLNATNIETLQGLFGYDSDAWSRQAIELYPTETDFKGKSVPCLRIRGVDADAVAVKHSTVRAEDLPAGVPSDSEIPF